MSRVRASWRNPPVLLVNPCRFHKVGDALPLLTFLRVLPLGHPNANVTPDTAAKDETESAANY
jgi:hypothetical protein